MDTMPLSDVILISSVSSFVALVMSFQSLLVERHASELWSIEHPTLTRLSPRKPYLFIPPLFVYFSILIERKLTENRSFGELQNTLHPRDLSIPLVSYRLQMLNTSLTFHCYLSCLRVAPVVRLLEVRREWILSVGIVNRATFANCYYKITLLLPEQLSGLLSSSKPDENALGRSCRREINIPATFELLM